MNFTVCNLTDNVVAENDALDRASFRPSSTGLTLVWTNIVNDRQLAKVALAAARWWRRNK